MTDDGFDTETNDRNQFRWVFTGGGGGQFFGPTWHATREEALRAGRTWLELKHRRD